jgi:hemerythrin
MAFIDWTDALSVNVKIIDAEHKRLVAMINELHEALVNRKGKSQQQKIVHDMVDYAASHFTTEEKYMRQYSFPGFEGHKKEHELFTEKALDLKERGEKTGFVLTLEILNFLRDWLKNHILKTDKKYSQFFNEHGLY